MTLVRSKFFFLAVLRAVHLLGMILPLESRPQLKKQSFPLWVSFHCCNKLP
jgi:hypothetical protein